ncbi:GAF domain-containing protein [Streptomyces sp. NPDC058644]|uniref:GAF and ANTAR domain-containing protein n=1 Tax=unclassified Streptomyces TaxID=2593676 RepID=UPI0036577A16
MVGDAGQAGEPLLVVSEVAAALAGATPLELPQRLCEAYQQAMGADSVVLSLMPHTAHWHLVHATSPLARQGEETQFTLGDGPTITASACAHPVLVPDLRTSTWPLNTQFAEYLPTARTVLAIPVMLRARDLGVVTLYYTQPRTVTENEIEHAQCAAYLAVEPLLQARETLTADGKDWPGVCARWRTVHQAIGMVTARLDCPAIDALDLLRSYSFTTGRSLPDIATILMSDHRGPEDLDDDPDCHTPA